MILVTGINGQLGYDVVKELERRNIECKGTDINELDITDEAAVDTFIQGLKPTAVIHCAAYTAVDGAEDNLELCDEVNAKGPRYLAAACKKTGAKMMYISTDYVFQGDGVQPYEVTDSPNPLGAYGKTKLDGEKNVQALLQEYFIVRISWVFGINGNNFINTMLRLGSEKETLNVVNDQIGAPTYTYDLAKLLCDMIETEKYGIYHATNEGDCSWAEFATEIMKQAGLACVVKGIPSEAYPTKAPRPKNSRMSKKSLDEAGFDRLPNWSSALQRYLEEKK